MPTVFRGPHGAPVRRTPPSLWVRSMRRCRVVLLLGATLFALVGALTTPPYVVLVLAPVCGIFFASVVAVVNPAFPKDSSARRTVVFSWAGATLFIPCLAGIGQFGSLGTVAAMVLMVLGCVVVGDWIVECSNASDRGAGAGMDVEQLQQLFYVLPTSMLLGEWRATGELMQTGADPDRRDEAVLVRTLLMEELSRRDPEGVARWLEGEEDAPEQYLRGDSGAAT